LNAEHEFGCCLFQCMNDSRRFLSSVSKSSMYIAASPVLHWRREASLEWWRMCCKTVFITIIYGQLKLV